MAILSSSELLAALLSLFVFYTPGLVLYRLYLSPLAKFPGPKLAAATLWYEFYYDVVKRGRYTWKIQELHEQYGMRSHGKYLAFLVHVIIMQVPSYGSVPMSCTSTIPSTLLLLQAIAVLFLTPNLAITTRSTSAVREEP